MIASLSFQHRREMDVTMTDIEAMNVTLRNMQEETEKLSRVIHCLLQAGMVTERLVSLRQPRNRARSTTYARQPYATRGVA